MNAILAAVAQEREAIAAVRSNLDARERVLGQIEALAVELNGGEPVGPETAGERAVGTESEQPALPAPPEPKRAVIDQKLFALLRERGPLRALEILALPEIPWARSTVMASLARMKATGKLETIQIGEYFSYRAVPNVELPIRTGSKADEVAVRTERVFAYIKEHPGCSLRDLRNGLLLGDGTYSQPMESM